jgi:hypothetical protein
MRGSRESSYYSGDMSILSSDGVMLISVSDYVYKRYIWWSVDIQVYD